MCNNENHLTTAPHFLTQLIFQARNMTGSNIRNLGDICSWCHRNWLCLITSSYHRSAHSSGVAEGCLTGAGTGGPGASAGGVASAASARQGGVTSADGALGAGAAVGTSSRSRPTWRWSLWLKWHGSCSPSLLQRWLARLTLLFNCQESSGSCFGRWTRWIPLWRRRHWWWSRRSFCLDRCPQGQPLHWCQNVCHKHFCHHRPLWQLNPVCIATSTTHGLCIHSDDCCDIWNRTCWTNLAKSD